MTEDADDLEASFKKLYEGGYLSTEHEFLQKLRDEEGALPPGELIDTSGDCKVYFSTINTLGFVAYKPFLQAFLLIFIDGA